MGGKVADHKLKGLFTSKDTEYETPQWLFDLLDEEFHFTTDVCAIYENAKCKKFYSPAQDAFKLEWNGNCWMNPPYGREIGKWMARAYHQAKKGNGTVVCLVPARTDTRWWWNYVRFGEVRFLKGRLKFGDGSGSAPFPSAIVIYRKGLPMFPSTTYWKVTDGQ